MNVNGWNGLLGEHGGSILCRYNHGMVWNGLERIQNGRTSKFGFLRANVHVSVQTLGHAEKWMGLNVHSERLNIEACRSFGVGVK